MGLFDDTLVDQYNENGELTMKVCGCCGKLKSISNFYRNGKGPSGRIRYRRDCKACYNLANEGRTQAYRDRKWEERYGVAIEDLEIIKSEEL